MQMTATSTTLDGHKDHRKFSSKLRPSAGGEDARWRTRAREFIEQRLDLAIGAIIIVNVIYVYTELERAGFEVGLEKGFDTGEPWQDWDAVFAAIANVFAAIFILELMVKVFFFRCAFFRANGHLQKFNIFDALVVLASCIDLWIISPTVGSRTTGSSVQVVRLFRFLRVLRTLRIVRSFEIFAKLRVLVTTVIASFFALFWSLVLLSVVMLMAALVMCQSINLILIDDSIPATFDKLDYYRHFGTPSRSLWTMFEITFGGGWQKHARPLIEEVSIWWVLFFVVYIAGVIFAMFKIITALFLKDILAIAAQDAESVIQDKMKEKARYANKLLDVFTAADASGDGYMTWEEFEELLQDEGAAAYLTTLELDPASTKLLFFMLDDGDNRVSVQEFVHGALRLKGQARSADVVSIMHDCSKLVQKLGGLEKSLEDLTKAETTPTPRILYNGFHPEVMAI